MAFKAKKANTRRMVERARAWRERRLAAGDEVSVRELAMWGGWTIGTATAVLASLGPIAGGGEAGGARAPSCTSLLGATE